MSGSLHAADCVNFLFSPTLFYACEGYLQGTWTSYLHPPCKPKTTSGMRSAGTKRVRYLFGQVSNPQSWTHHIMGKTSRVVALAAAGTERRTAGRKVWVGGRVDGQISLPLHHFWDISFS